MPEKILDWTEKNFVEWEKKEWKKSTGNVSEKKKMSVFILKVFFRGRRRIFLREEEKKFC